MSFEKVKFMFGFRCSSNIWQLSKLVSFGFFMMPALVHAESCTQGLVRTTKMSMSQINEACEGVSSYAEYLSLSNAPPEHQESCELGLSRYTKMDMARINNECKGMHSYDEWLAQAALPKQAGKPIPNSPP